MAPRVIIEQQQIANQPIGVVRVGDGNVTANAIADSADRIAGMLFKRAGEDAEANATELAQSIGQANVLAIDPATGAPVALSDMAGMGRIGSEAYRRVINSRFQQGIEEEIRAQAQVLAAQYEDSSDPVGMYTSAMSDYIASMANNATGSWRSFIEDAGTSYLNRTRAALGVQQLRRSRAALADAQRRANAEALIAIEASVAQGGMSALDGVQLPDGGSIPSIVESIGQSAVAANEDAVEAQVLPPSVLNSLPVEGQMAVARGMVRNWTQSLDISNPGSEEQITFLKAAIGSQDIYSVARIAPELVPYLGFLQARPDLFREFESFSDGLLTDVATLARIESAPVAAQQEAVRRQAIAAFGDQTAFAAGRIEREVRMLPGSDLAPYVRQITQELSVSRQAALQVLDEDQRRVQLERVDALSKGLRDGLFSQLTAGKTQDDIDRLRAAFSDRNVSGLSDEERTIFGQLQTLETVLPGAITDLDPMFRNARETARFAQDQAQRGAFDQSRNLLLNLPSMAALRGGDIDTFASQLLSNLGGIANLSEGDLRAAEREVNGQAMRSHLADAFGFAQDETELTLLRGVLSNTVDLQALPPHLQASGASIEAARLYATQTSDDILSASNDIVTRRTNEMRVIELERNKAQMRLDVTRGLGNPTDPKSREAADEVIALMNGGPLAADFFTSPDYINDPNFNEIMRYVGNTPGFLPESLYRAFSAIAQGNLRPSAGFDPATVLNHWQNFRTVDVFGSEFRNSGANALSERDIAILDLMVDSVPFFGTDGFAEAYRSAQLVQRSPEFQGQVSAVLDGQTLGAWLGENVSGYDQLNAGQRSSIQGVAATLLAMSQADSRIGSGQSWLKNRLETHLDNMLPNSGGVVIEHDSNGLASSRTSFALEAVLGENAASFRTYVLNDVARLAPDFPQSFSTPETFSLRPMLTSAGFVRPQPYIYLVPYGRDPQGGVSYYVHSFDPETAQTRRVIRNDNRSPLIVSTSEADFVNSLPVTDYIGPARSRRELLDRFGTETGSYLGVQ